jgi:hypothetical protein
MEMLLLISACVYSVPTAAIATFVTWLVCRNRKRATKPDYRAVFFRWLIGVFFGYLILVFIATGGNLSPAGH